MAEAVVKKLRAVYLSGDFDNYWPVHIQQEQNRLPVGPTAVLPWENAKHPKSASNLRSSNEGHRFLLLRH